MSVTLSENSARTPTENSKQRLRSWRPEAKRICVTNAGEIPMRGTTFADQIRWEFNAGVISIPSERGQLRVAACLSVAVSNTRHSLGPVSAF